MYKPLHQRIRLFNYYLSIMFMAALSSNAFSQNVASDFAGSVVYSIGDVVAVDTDGETRPLARRAEIFIGDTLYTGPDSSVQLSMSDSAQIILHESTVFQIRNYIYESGADDSIILDLIEGGFRTVTGSVLKDQYRANVLGFSSIGIRGTEYEAWKPDSNRLLVGIYEGGITLSNFGGELELGIGADFDFAEVENMLTAPIGLEDMPAGLDVLQFVEAAVITEQELDANAIAGTAGPLDPNSNLIAAIDPNITQFGPDIGISAAGDFFSYVASLAVSDNEETAVAALAPDTDEAESNDADTNSGSKSSTTARNRRISRSQAVSTAETLVEDAIDTLDATEVVVEIAAIEPVEVVNEFLEPVTDLPQLLYQSTLASAVSVELLQQETALLAVLPNTGAVLTTPVLSAVFDAIGAIDSTLTAVVVEELAISELAKQAVVDIDAVTDPLVDRLRDVAGSLPNNEVIEVVESVVAEVLESNPLAVNDVVDELPAGVVEDLVTAPVDETAEIIESIAGPLVVAPAEGVSTVVEDLPVGTVGELVAASPVDVTVEIIETIAGPLVVAPAEGVSTAVADLSVEVVEELVADAAVDETVEIIETIAGPLVVAPAEGVSTVVEDLSVEVVEESVTASPIDEIVEAVVEEVAAVVEDLPIETIEDQVAALAGEGGLEEAAVIFAGPPVEVVPEVEEESVVAVVLGGAKKSGSLLALRRAPVSQPGEAAADVNWGAWNSPVPEHIANSMTISAGDYNVDLTPAPFDNLTGSYKYSEVIGYQGHGSAGALTSLQAGFDVNFDTGVISNGRLSVAVEESQNWLLGFGGLIEQGVVDLNSLGGSMIELGPLFDNVHAIDGDLSGAFAGEHAETFIGGFELLDLQNPLNTVEGIYTLER